MTVLFFQMNFSLMRFFSSEYAFLNLILGVGSNLKKNCVDLMS
jgi:hypothetical protein